MPGQTPSARGNKAEENHHRALGTNLIGTLQYPAQPSWIANNPAGQTLLNALNHHIAANNLPLLWAYSVTPTSYEIKFGFDMNVPSLAVGALPGATAKIGHVALFNDAIISGEIAPNGGGWRIDNNSGAWGAMGGQADKSNWMDNVANAMSQLGNINVVASRAYSRRGWKRAIQQVFR